MGSLSWAHFTTEYTENQRELTHPAGTVQSLEPGLSPQKQPAPGGRERGGAEGEPTHISPYWPSRCWQGALGKASSWAEHLGMLPMALSSDSASLLPQPPAGETFQDHGVGGETVPREELSPTQMEHPHLRRGWSSPLPHAPCPIHTPTPATSPLTSCPAPSLPSPTNPCSTELRCHQACQARRSTGASAPHTPPTRKGALHPPSAQPGH